MKGFAVILGSFLCLIASSVHAQTKNIHFIKVEPVAEGQTRILLSADKSLTTRSLILKNSNRWVLDLSEAKLSDNILLNLEKGNLQAVRFAKSKGKGEYRLVLDYGKQTFEVINEGKQDRNSYVEDRSWLIKTKKATASTAAPQPKPTKKTKTKSNDQPSYLLDRDIVIVLDAGHGGKDSGALSKQRLAGSNKQAREKAIVLSVAENLAKLLANVKGYKVIMTRSTDTYITLGKRKRIAKENNADLFISIHADAAPNQKAQGASVYAFSDKGATSELAKFLAAGKSGGSASDARKIADYTLTGTEADQIVGDFSTEGVLILSEKVGDALLGHLGKVGRLHKKRVGRANFAVLKNFDVPSVLVELGFLTNSKDSKNLGWKQYRENLAKALFWGITSYYATSQDTPSDTYIGRVSSNTLQYTIQKGDYLGLIAKNYGIKLKDIYKANNLNSKSTLEINHNIILPAKY